MFGAWPQATDGPYVTLWRVCEHYGLPKPTRVTLAHELVSQKQLDIEHVAERAGFRSTRQRRRAWRRLYGRTPSQGRAR